MADSVNKKTGDKISNKKNSPTLDSVRKKVKDKLLSVNQISSKLKLHKYYKDFLSRKYKGKKLSEQDWKVNLKKDGLDF